MPTTVEIKSPVSELEKIIFREKSGNEYVAASQSDLTGGYRILTGKVISIPKGSKDRVWGMRLGKGKSREEFIILRLADLSKPSRRLPPAKLPVNDPAGEYVQSLKDAEGGAWSTAEFMELAHISRQALQERRANFTIAYWTDAKGHCHYPKWQFDPDRRVLSHVRTILGLLHTHDTLRVLTTFLVPSIGEPGVSALSMIQDGRGDEAVAAVRALEDEH